MSRGTRVCSGNDLAAIFCRAGKSFHYGLDAGRAAWVRVRWERYPEGEKIWVRVVLGRHVCDCIREAVCVGGRFQAASLVHDAVRREADDSLHDEGVLRGVVGAAVLLVADFAGVRRHYVAAFVEVNLACRFH